MNTQYGAYAQSGLTGHRTTNNGVQGQPHFTAQQPDHVNAMNTATPNHNNFYPTMPIARGALHTQRPLPYGQPDFAVQQLVGGNSNGNGMHRSMTFRNRQGPPAQFANGNAHPVHNGPPAQPVFGGHMQQMFDLNGSEVAMAVAADPNAMAGLSQLRNAILRQRAEVQNTQYQQNYQVQQHQQSHRDYNGGGEFNYIPTPTGSAVSSGEDLPDLTRQSTANITQPANRTNFPVGYPNRPVASTPHNTGAAEPVQPAMGPELTDDFQELVNGLVAQRGTAFGGHIRSDADVARFEKAIWMAKSKGGKLQVENKCADFPNDETERSNIVWRIFNAIVNTQGDQDLATDAAENGDCLAVRVIKGMSPLEVEILAKKLMDNSVKVQRGDPVLPPHFKVVQEETLMAKVNKLVEALSHDKALCRSATTTAEWIARIAADPAGERVQKNFNRNNNRAKNTVLKADAQKKGKSRAKGKGKGKRAAEGEAEAEPSQQAPAEVTEAAGASQSRPAKRARNTKTAAQTTQPNTQRQNPDQMQVSQVQRTSVDSNKGHENTHPLNAVQGAINPNQGPVDPTNQHTNNISHSAAFVQQTQQTNLPYVFGQNQQSNFDPSSFAQEFQPMNLFPTQIDGASNLSPNAAANQNTGLELAQSQSDMCNNWMAFLNSDAMDGSDFDFSSYSAPQDGSAMNQQVVRAQQNIPRQPAQYQPVPQQQQVQQPQIVEAPVQQWSQEGENADQINNSFFGSLSYEELEAQLAPIARFNAEN